MKAANNKVEIDKIKDALSQIRPFLEADGGNVTFEEITDDYVVKVKLHGACSSCSMSAMTMQAGIEEAVKRASTQVKAVIAI